MDGETTTTPRRGRAPGGPGPTGQLERLGKYRLVRHLASGGMGEVFLATVHGEAGFTKQVAIKRLHPNVSADHECVQMLIDEARITAQLMHTNICQVIDLGVRDGSYFIAMEYVPGVDLAALHARCIETAIRFPLDAALFIVSEVLAGLDYAHRRTGPDGKAHGVIHRDISPQNILISYEGEVKIIDFGIAKARNRLVRTEAGVIKGKYHYMSPEQALGRALDHRTDIYSAGAVLYELLRGQTPLAGLDHTEMLRRIVDPQFDPLHRHRQDISPELDRIIRRAVARKPGRRYRSAEAFHAALAELLQTSRQYGRSELSAFIRSLWPAPARRATTFDTGPLTEQPTNDLRREGLPFHDTEPAGPSPALAPRVTRTLVAARFQPSRRVTQRTDPPTGVDLEHATAAALEPPTEPPSLPPPLASLADSDTEFRTAVFRWRRLALMLLGVVMVGAALALGIDVTTRGADRTAPGAAVPEDAALDAGADLAAARPKPRRRRVGRRTRRPHRRRAARPDARTKPGPGTLQVTCVYHGVVFVDGKQMGSAPGLTLSLPEGRHRVEVHFPDLGSSSARWVTIRADRTSRLHFSP